jgi:acyl-CoA hydrolase
MTHIADLSSAQPSRPRETVFVEMIFPDQANHYGTLYGGNALGLLGKAAFVTATRFARCAVVMAASEHVDFLVPVKLGQMLELTGRILRVGRSSMSVEVSGVAETLAGGERLPALRGRFEMVAVDGEGRPKAIASGLNVRGEQPASRS